MAYVTKGANLSPSKIQKTIKLLRPSERELVLAYYWEFIPDDKEYTDDEKLAFVIAAQYRAGSYPADAIRTLLLQNPVLEPNVNPHGYLGAKPNLYHRLMAAAPATLQECISYMRPHKHVPEDILKNDMFVGLVVMTQFIDWLYNGDVGPLAGIFTRYTPEKIDAVDRILTDDMALTDSLREYAKGMRQAHIMMGGK